jgi:hypothetical protein
LETLSETLADERGTKKKSNNTDGYAYPFDNVTCRGIGNDIRQKDGKSANGGRQGHAKSPLSIQFHIGTRYHKRMELRLTARALRCRPSLCD